MNKVEEKTTVTQVETLDTRWLSTTRGFLQIPNLAILKVLFISSCATFTSGISSALEWIFHGKSHTGFGWIIYYALFLICLPLLILIGFRILMAISSSNHGSSQTADSVAATKPCTDVSEAQPTEETERNSCRRLAIVVDSDERNSKKKSDDEKMPKIKRAVSFPSHGEVRSCRTR